EFGEASLHLLGNPRGQLAEAGEAAQGEPGVVIDAELVQFAPPSQKTPDEIERPAHKRCLRAAGVPNELLRGLMIARTPGSNKSALSARANRSITSSAAPPPASRPPRAAWSRPWPRRAACWPARPGARRRPTGQCSWSCACRAAPC